MIRPRPAPVWLPKQPLHVHHNDIMGRNTTLGPTLSVLEHQLMIRPRPAPVWLPKQPLHHSDIIPHWDLLFLFLITSFFPCPGFLVWLFIPALEWAAKLLENDSLLLVSVWPAVWAMSSAEEDEDDG